MLCHLFVATLLSGRFFPIEPAKIRPLPAAYYRLSEIVRRLKVEDQVSVAIPGGYANLPIFVASKTYSPSLFVERLGTAFDCTVAVEGPRSYRLIPRKILPPALSMISLGQDSPPFDRAVAMRQFHELAKLEKQGLASGERWDALTASLSINAKSPFPLSLRLSRPSRCGALFYSDHPNQFENLLPSEIVETLRPRLEARRVANIQTAAIAAAEPELRDYDFSTSSASQTGDVIVLRIDEGGPSLSTADALLCTNNGEELAKLLVQISAPAVSLKGLGVPQTQPNLGSAFTAVARKVWDLRNQQIADPRAPKMTEVLLGHLLTEEPLEITTGPILRDWASHCGRDLFVRVPDSYFVEAIGNSEYPDSAPQSFFETLKHDPYLQVVAEHDAIFVGPHNPQLCGNEDRSILERNLNSWLADDANENLLSHAAALSGPWRESPECKLVPVLTNRWNSWFERYVETLRAFSLFDFRQENSAISPDQAAGVFEIARHLYGGPIVTFNQQVSEGETVEPRNMEFCLSRVLGEFNLLDRAILFERTATKIELHPVNLIGIGFDGTVKLFAPLRAAKATVWAEPPACRRIGHYLYQKITMLLLGRAWSPGIRFSISIPQKAVPFDLITLDGLPEAVKQQVEALTPPGTFLQAKP